MAKKLILGIATLTIILVLFAIYHLATTGSDYARDTDIVFDPRNLPQPTTTTAPGKVLQVGEVAIPPGEGVEFEAFDEHGRVQTRFRADRWAPLSEREFELHTARVEVVLPSGQIAHIEADEGQVMVQPGGKQNLDPKSGWLRGHVHVYIDRSTREDREANPETAASEDRPDDLIHIWMDEVHFDLDLSRLTTKSEFRVQAVEADVEGAGLALRWNEPAARIEELRIDKVERMELRRGADLIKFGVPGTRRSKPSDPGRRGATAMAAARLEGSADGASGAGLQAVRLPASPVANQGLVLPAPAPAPRRTAPTTAAASAPAGDRLPDEAARWTLIQLARAKKEKKRRITTYRARFEGPLRVESRSGLEELGQVTATDALELLFDFDSDSGKQAEAAPATQPAAADEETVGAPTTQPEAPETERKIVLTCDGSFTMKPIAEPEEPQTGKRFRVEVTGAPVVVTEQQGRVVGRKIVYEQESDRVWLDGDAGAPAELRTDDGRELKAEHLFLDLKLGVARVNGPGQMADVRELAARIAMPTASRPTATAPADGEAKPGSGFRITWETSVELKFDEQPTRVPNAEGTGFEIEMQRVLKRAAFRGGVVMAQGQQSLAADAVELRFAPPRSRGEIADTLDEILADGHVVLRDDLSRIVCRRLHVEMVEGSNDPSVARAIGAVRVEQGEPIPLMAQVFGAESKRVVRWITADDRLIVHFAQIRRDAEPWDIEKAKQFARKQGHDAEKVDWDKQREKYEARQMEVRMVTMVASGDVEARDISDESPMEVQAETVRIETPNGRAISKVHLDGTESRMASAAMGDYFLRGHTIDANVPDEQADVPGPGELMFVSAESLDGRRRENPVPVHITWTERMALRGEDHLALFAGTVHGESEDSTLDCDESLRVELVSLPPKPKVVEASAPKGARGLWLLRPFLDRSSGSRDPVRPYAGRFEKRISRLLASGNARVLSSDIDTRTGRLIGRTYIAGPKLAVDLDEDEERLNVDGAGDLLIEDYRLPDDRKRGSEARASGGSGLALGSEGLGGPSQTLIHWANAMSFFVKRNVAAFDRDVQLTHRAGTEMALLQGLAQSLNVDTDSLRHLEGRRANLTATDHLAVTFRRDPDRSTGDGALDGLGGTTLERFDASGDVHLTEGTKSLSGQRVIYTQARDRVTVWGGRGTEALLSIEDEQSGQFLAWQGPKLLWTPSTNAVQFPRGRIISSGR